MVVLCNPARGYFFVKMLEKIRNIGPLFVIVAALLWSVDGIFRINLYALPPTVIVFYEHLLGAGVLLVLIKKWLPDLSSMTRKEWIGVATVSLCSGALGTIFYTAALGQINYTQYSVVVLLQQQLQPIWAIGTAAILLREKISKKFIMWAFVALVGAYFVTFKDGMVNLNTGSGTIIAALFALSAGLLWGSSTAVSKLVLNKISFLTATALRFFFASFFAFIILLGNGQYKLLAGITSPQWGNLLFITFSTGMVALLIYYYGLKKTPARVATICELVWPISAICIDYFYFDKVLSHTQIIGIGILLFAIYKVTQYKQ